MPHRLRPPDPGAEHAPADQRAGALDDLDALDALAELGSLRQEAVLPSALAARMLGVRRRTLEQWRYRGTSPRYIRLGGNRVGYRLRDLLAWIAERESGGG